MEKDPRFEGGWQPVRDALHHPVHERFDPPLTPIPLEEVKEFCGAVLAEMESRKNNKPTTRKKAA